MAFPAQHNFISNFTSLVDAGAEYKLHRCIPLPGQKRLVYITLPLSFDTNRPHRKCSVVGIYDQRQKSLVSVVQKGYTRVSRACGLASWREGIIICGPEGITYMNASNFTTRCLLSVEIGASGFRCLSDIAVLGYDNSIWFTDTDYSFHDATASKIYCFDPATSHLYAAASDVEVPVNIAFSSDSSKCYVSDAGSGSIVVYDVMPSKLGHKLTNRTRFVYLDSATTHALKVDRDGMVFAALDNRIVCWDRHGKLKHQIVLDDPVADFYLQGKSITLIQSQSIIQLDLCQVDLDARL